MSQNLTKMRADCVHYEGSSGGAWADRCMMYPLREAAAACVGCADYKRDMNRDPRYQGKDNDGRPRSLYLAKIAAMDDAALAKECESKIWLSAYAGNNPRSDFHWQCDACYDESERRGKGGSGGIYDRAYKRVERSVRGG